MDRFEKDSQDSSQLGSGETCSLETEAYKCVNQERRKANLSGNGSQTNASESSRVEDGFQLLLKLV